MFRVCSLPTAIGFLLSTGAYASTIHVPADSPTIQAAIDASNHLDTIVVAPGTYVEQLSFGGKLVTLTSTDPTNPSVVAATIIAAAGDRAVGFSGTEVSVATLTGFTITGGERGINGINCNNATPTIRNCVITRVHGPNNGAAIAYCNGLIENCTVKNNDAAGFFWCNGTIRNCVISGNDQTAQSYEGSGITLGSGLIQNCTIVGNRNGGVFQYSGTIRNCIIWGNYARQIGQSSPPTYSLIQGGASGVGNISLDPRFSVSGYQNSCLWVDGDYHLEPDSPAINAGDPNFVAGTNEYDLDGNPRIINGRVDMGAYEYAFVGCDLDFDGDGIANCLDADIDNDGVLNGPDLCDNTAPGIAVDGEGRPLADLDKNCRTDAADLALFRQGYDGVLECVSVPAVGGVGLTMMLVAMLAAGGYIIQKRKTASAA